MRRIRRVPPGLVGVVGLFAAWEAAHHLGLLPGTYLVPPSTVLPAMAALLGDTEFLRAVVATVLATLIAVCVAIAVAVPAGLLLGSVASVRRAAMTLVEFLRPIPSVALIPLAAMTFGSGPDTKIILAVYAAVWPILFNTVYALDELDPLHVDTARAFGTGRVGVLTRVALPSAAPFVLTGVRLSTAMALAVVISAELYAGNSLGIGQFIMVVGSSGSYMDQVLAATVLAGLIGYAANAGLERLHRKLFFWAAPKGDER